MNVVHGYTELFAPVFMEIIISGIIVGLGWFRIANIQ
jgi:hypothetical protein